MTIPLPLLATAAFLFGLMAGSFLNVVIWRLPAEEQVVRGRSHCRGCGKAIPWYDNIPLVSFARLKGRCRFCQAKISWSYPLVELATGLLFAGTVLRFGQSPLVWAYWILGAALIALSVIDWKEMILPDEITMPGISFGVILSFYLPQLHGETGRWAALWAGVVGALAGAGTLWVVGVVGKWVFRREAMGLGDVKLMAMVGAFIGLWKVLLVNLVLAPVAGALVGLVLKVRYGRDLIPFGPFLALGTLAAIFWGDAILNWYGGLLGWR